MTQKTLQQKAVKVKSVKSLEFHPYSTFQARLMKFNLLYNK